MHPGIQTATKLSQHISFLKDFFRCYKDFDDRHIDTIEIMLSKLYKQCGISDHTDFSTLSATDYPILSDLYGFIENEYKSYDKEKYQLYSADLLQEILLGLHSMCMGAESKFFNGHTNVTSDRFIVFGVKGLLQASRNVKNALLFNVLSFMSDKLLTEGNTAASIDELYLFLTNLTAIEYIRNFMKRVRKKDSAVILASQNLEDFNIEGIRELTKPLFSIPTHAFLFNAGNIDKQFYIDSLQLEESEFNLIRYPQRGDTSTNAASKGIPCGSLFSKGKAVWKGRRQIMKKEKTDKQIQKKTKQDSLRICSFIRYTPNREADILALWRNTRRRTMRNAPSYWSICDV